MGGSGTGTVDVVGAGAAGVDSTGGAGSAVEVDVSEGAAGADGASDSAGHGRHSGTKCRFNALSMLPAPVPMSAPSPSLPLE